MKKKFLGSKGFPKEYWDINYEEPEEMDNIVNAKEHAEYMRALFALQMIDINSVVDLGFGLGHLFKEVLKTFKPYRALGIEPSQFPYEVVSKKKLTTIESTKLKLLNIDLVSWSKTPEKKSEVFDLGICTSVFQYLTDEEIKTVLPIMSERIRYLYFSVPTNIEYERQISEMDFHDEYAIHRTQKDYLKLLAPHFAIVANRLLESKIHFNEKTTPFNDLLFRF